MPAPQDKITQIGAQRAYQDPNDAALTGTYRDAAAELSPEQRSPLVNFPVAPTIAPYSIKGG